MLVNYSCNDINFFQISYKNMLQDVHLINVIRSNTLIIFSTLFTLDSVSCYHSLLLHLQAAIKIYLNH